MRSNQADLPRGRVSLRVQHFFFNHLLPRTCRGRSDSYILPHAKAIGTSVESTTPPDNPAGDHEKRNQLAAVNDDEVLAVLMHASPFRDDLRSLSHETGATVGSQQALESETFQTMLLQLPCDRQRLPYEVQGFHPVHGPDH